MFGRFLEEYGEESVDHDEPAKEDELIEANQESHGRHPNQKRGRGIPGLNDQLALCSVLQTFGGPAYNMRYGHTRDDPSPGEKGVYPVRNERMR